MAASLLEENLRLLHECIAGDASQKEQSVGIVADLTQICIFELSDKDIDFCCSCLFSKETGLTTFLSKTVTCDELQACKAKVLEFLSSFVEKVEKKVLPYAVDIKDVCLSVFSRDRFAKVKNAALPLLSRVLEITVGSSMGKDLNIDKMINKFFNEIIKGKQSATVKEKIYILLGVIAEIYPEEMTPYAERLTNMYIGALRAEINSKIRKPELSIIAGCLEGLCGSLVNFTEAAEENSKNAYEIFKYARNSIDPKVELSRYEVPRAGLRLLAKHASQFNQFLVEDYEGMFEKMSYWSHHKNAEMVNLGMRAIEAFLSQISEMLVQGEGETIRKKAIFKFFLCQFREVMQSNTSTVKELSLAITGYGLLAAPCRSLMTAADVKFMFNEMMTKTEQQFLGEAEDMENRLHNLASYLESLASIVREMEEISETSAMSLEHLLVLLLENIPSIHKTKHFLCLRSMLWVLLAVMPRGSAFRQILSGFVYQGLIRTCSHPPVVQTENEGEVAVEDTGERKVTYKEYMELWSGLLDSARFKEFAAADISLDACHQLTDALYSELMTSVLRILDRLDLSSAAGGAANESQLASSSMDDQDVLGLSSADPLLGIQANKPQDFQIFINLVDFCRDLLPMKHFQKFECWVFTMSHKLILMSTDNPLVSGFYKLLSVSMKIASKLHYFQNIGNMSESSRPEAMEVDADTREGIMQKTACYHLIKKFSKEVLVRMKQYRDDLLASCLTFILALPKEVIAEQMADVVPAIQVTLDIGLSYLPLAMVALDALEFWSASLPAHVIEPYYPNILPCLDSFLKTSKQGVDDATTESSVNVTKSKSGKGRKKLNVRLIKGSTASTSQSYESQLSRVKVRIIKYLGQLGGNINACLLAGTEEEISKRAIAWDSLQHLKFEMPFVDMKPTIYLDAFLPQIVELSTKSSDRQTKVAACELLHSLILYCLGRGSYQSGSEAKRESMAPLYKNLFPTILKLACDVEQVCKQLFEPLMMQMIHWFTSNQQAESEETIALLDSIYDGMIQQSDTGLRDFSARCLHEFLKWSIKQTKPKKGSESSPVNAKSVLRRLFSYALHPSAFKRLGASLAFNNIYTVFREDESLVDRFTFELLVHFVESLSIAHNDEKSLGTQEQCCKALEHLEKIIRQKAPLLRKESKQRKEPKQWTSITLDIAVRWLIRQCGRPQTECRHACMKLSYQLCPLIQGINSTAKFFQSCLKGKGADYFMSRFEGGGHSGSEKRGLDGYSTLVAMADVFSLQTTLSWFDMVLAVLDCYTWVFGEGLLTPAEMFGSKGKGSEKTQVFTALEYFMQHVAMANIEQVSKLFKVKVEADIFTPREKDDFNRAKCTVVVRLLSFLTVMLAKFRKETVAAVPRSIWGAELWELVCSCVVQPTVVGFNMGDVEIMKNLPTEMEQTLVVVSSSFQDDMKKHFSKLLTGDRNLFPMLPLPLDDTGKDYVHLQQMIFGYGQLHKVNLLLPCLSGSSKDKYSQQLFDNVYQGIVTSAAGDLTPVTLTPTVHAVCKAMLELSFLMGLPANTVVARVLDRTVVGGGGSSGSQQLQGDLFFSLFKSSLTACCARHIADVVPLLVKEAAEEPGRVSAVLTAIVHHVSRDRELRKKEGTTVLNTVLAHWHQLSCWWENKASAELQGMALLLLTKLLLIDSKFASDPRHKAFDFVFTMYQTMLTDSKTNLAFKGRVLEVLPFFAAVPDTHTAKLKSSLDRLVADNFPLRSSEFPKGTPKYQDYITALDRILTGFQLSGSLMLLQFIISIFCREKKHIHEDEIQNAITKFTRRLPRDKQKDACNVPYNIFVKVGSFPAEIRRATIERVCLSMLRLVNKSVLIEFYLDHITEIKHLMEAKLTKSSESALEGQLVSRLCCFQLLEVMYSRLSKDEVVGMSSAINKKFADGNVQTGKELTSFVSKVAHDAKGEDIRGEAMLLELRRQYHCAAYNLMIAFISCTQTELKYYTAFLFEEKEAKGQFLLENFIDKERDYEFPVELMSPMERKKRFVSIHKEVKEKKVSDEDDSLDDYSPSVHLASQYLADSSLSEDISQYSFSIAGSTGSFAGQGRRRRAGHKSSSKSPEEDMEVEVTVEENYVELEMDELNQHECMASMIAVIRHMVRSKISPAVTPGTTPGMPSWMEKLHAKMVNMKTSLNIRLFIVKLITNTADVFQPYASHWLKLLCQLILSSLSGGGITYFIVDVIVTMLSWHQTAIPQDTAEERAMASRLVHFVIASVYHETRAIFRNNIEMLKTLLECWRERVEIPYKVIYGQFHITDSSKDKDKLSTVGCQVLGVVLACKFPPYGPVALVDRERYFSVFANHMGSRSKTVYAPVAEVCGLIFQYLAEKEGETDGTFHTHVTNLMVSLQQAKPDNFITCVQRMQKHYPPIADRFINNLLFMLPKLQGEYRSLCLEILHSRIDQLDNPYLELRSKGIDKFLSHRDEETQAVSLKIVKAILGKLKPAELTALMPRVTAFVSNPSNNCRNIMYEILMWVYDNYRNEETEESHNILQQTKETLLRGLGDEDVVCRLLVQNFWSSETRLPVGTLDRLVAMLEAMYSPVTEQQFLSYATNLLLEMTSKSPDYQREIFERPLSECKFADYAVKSSWKQRHAAMTPLFATQASQSQAMETEDSVDSGIVRATQDAQQFTQTVEAGSSRGPFNWLTQSSMDTYAEVSYVPTDTASMQSSLLFTVGAGDSQSKQSRRPKPGPGFGKQKLTTPKAGPSTQKEGVGAGDAGSELLRLKRRFLKDQAASSIFFAKRQTRIKEMREAAQREQRSRRENQVTMYRKYRSGDLPDIQIKYSYIIAPLQALAQRDSTVAKLLFSTIFQAIFAEMDKVKTEREMGETMNEINSSMDNILSVSTQYFPPFIGCLLNILYELRSQLKVDVSSVGGCAIFSKLQPLGIVVLEEQLILHDPGEARSSKRGRIDTQVSKDVSHWIELSRLYKSVDEYDVLLGIFSGKIGTQAITQEAIEAEARGDYSLAKKHYEKALQCDDWPAGRPLDAEIDLWDDCRMECLSNLSQWNDLQHVSTNAVDSESPADISKVWEDTFLQEHYLPFIMRSKVKLTLQGDENQQTLLNFVDGAMKDSEHKLVLENRYCEELALLYLWQEDYDRARHYTTMALDFFQQEWSSTDSLMTSSRTAALQKLQPLIELQEFLDFMASENNLRSSGPAKSLLKMWNRRSPHLLMDSVGIWDDVVTNRYVYLDHISSALQKQELDSQDSMETDTEDMFADVKLRLKLKMAESCREQNNFTLTLRILRETHGLCKRSEGDSLLCTWTHLYASTHHKKARATEFSEDTFNSVITTLDQLEKISDVDALKSQPSIKQRYYTLYGTGLELLALGVQGYDIGEFGGSKVGNKLMEYGKVKKLSQKQLADSLIEQGYQKMKAAVSVEPRPEPGASRHTDFGQEEAFLAAAKYCDGFLRLSEDDGVEISDAVLKSFPDTVIICMLKAMKLDSVEARQRFPRLLQLVELYPDTMATFIAKSSEVPSWMFILWISQMLAILDKSEAVAVHQILVDITELYPQAVVYPFKLSKEGYQFGQTPQGKKNETFVQRLSGMLTSDTVPMATRLMSALEQFAQPDQEFKEWFEKLRKLVDKKERSQLLKEYSKMYQELLEYKRPVVTQSTQLESLSTADDSVQMGRYGQRFADKFRKEFDTKFGKEGKKLVDMSLKEFRTVTAGINDMTRKEVATPKGTLNPPRLLAEYCQWLADFNSNTHTCSRQLEIPGQYTGLCKPLPDYHVKVAGFDQTVKVMTSLRKPKRITIRGNDERDYHFLVKGGEDLRQDQRIEQLFYIMNQVFNKDPTCRGRKLQLKTYQVIPMTTRVGMIEWVSDTIPLKDFLLESLSEVEKKAYGSKQGPKDLHTEWTYKFNKHNAHLTGQVYESVYKRYSVNDTVKQIGLVESRVPWDLSRRAFRKLSTSPEAFHVLRCKCIQTHSVLSVCHYILGIGDRHLSNFMVNLRTGEMVGIDFGHAFGSATQFLGVPELVPLRLTRQIRNLILPLQSKGLIDNTMIHVLRALRSDCDLLLNTLDIFVKEPSLDWLQNAERQMNTLTDEDMSLVSQNGDTEKEWYPKEKIRYVKRKLKGDNPCHITRDELKLGHGKKSVFKNFEDVVLGQADSIRKQLPATGLSVEQQVAALIDQATDPNILGRTWLGWEAYI